MAVMLVQTGLNVPDSSICEELFCAGEPVHFQPPFQKHLLLLNKLSMLGYAENSSTGGGGEGNTNIWRERGLLSALFWLWRSTYLWCSVRGNQKEGSKGREEMSQNSCTNDWNNPHTVISDFIILTYGIQWNCRVERSKIILKMIK